jgi:methylated-DNA-[protein]-cysteine S-methyltransferase
MKQITEFQKKVYEIVKKVPKGKVTTYKAIAMKLHSSPRAVGQALKVNPYSFSDGGNVPCHRVIMSDGKIGGFSGSNPKNIKRKIEMLRKEGYKSKAF